MEVKKNKIDVQKIEEQELEQIDGGILLEPPFPKPKSGVDGIETEIHEEALG